MGHIKENHQNLINVHLNSLKPYITFILHIILDGELFSKWANLTFSPTFFFSLQSYCFSLNWIITLLFYNRGREAGLNLPF